MPDERVRVEQNSPQWGMTSQDLHFIIADRSTPAKTVLKEPSCAMLFVHNNVLQVFPLYDSPP